MFFRSFLTLALALQPVLSLSTPRADASFPDLYEATIADLQAGLDAGHFTSVDLVTAYLARINEVNTELHAVIETNPTALAQAADLDAQRKQGKKLGSLHGIPILVKDNIATRFEDGMNTTAGSYAFLNSVVPGDATVLAKLRKAGTIILGKTNMSEWASFGSLVPDGWSGRGGQTTNAYYPRGDACASSSGSGVAASIGLAAATLGTETAGSITCPASYNNVVGVKATVGLTSRNGVVPISEHQDTVGACDLGASIQHCLQLPQDRWLALYRSTDNYTDAQPASVPDYTAGLKKGALKGARLGVPRAVFLDTKFGPVPGADAFKAALKTMTDLGAVITDPADVPSADEIVSNPAASIVLNTDLKFNIQSYLATLKDIPTNVHTVADIATFNDAHKDLEEPAIDAYVEWNLYFDLAEPTEMDDAYRKAVETNHDIGATRGIDAVLKKYNLDALVLPESGFMTQLAGFVTVPLGFRSNDTKADTNGGKDAPVSTAPGMPFGLTFVGTAFSESKLLALAYAYEQATQVRLQRRAYDKATPKTQLADVVGAGAGGEANGSSSTGTPTTSGTGPSGTHTGKAKSGGVSRGLWLVVASLVCVQGFFGWV
ncbi:amidase signature enzyme [Mycena vulgaris]|nr:amidase signature enzyme [Mycena vulgaris]